MKTEEQVRELVADCLDITDMKYQDEWMRERPWTECLLHILGERKSNGKPIEIIDDYYWFTDRKKENFRKKHGLRPMDESLKKEKKK